MTTKHVGMVPHVDDLSSDLGADIRLTADGVTVTVTGELDVHTAPRLHDALRVVVAEGAPLVRVHLDGLTFLDSTGLGVIVGAWKAQRAAGGDLEVVCSAPRVRRLLAVTGLDRLLRVHPTPARPRPDAGPRPASRVVDRHGARRPTRTGTVDSGG